jgi:hypothetical protein
MKNTDKYIWKIDAGDECADTDVTGPGWYFADETERLNGPYSSRQLAKDALNAYAKWLNGPKKD